MNASHSKKKVLILASGTGGHVMPALAVAEVLRAEGHELAWLGTQDGPEGEWVSQAGILFHGLEIPSRRAPGWWGRCRSLFQVLWALAAAFRMVRQIAPDVVLGLGGVASAPGALAACLLGIPLVLHEQNAKVGLTNRCLQRFAARLLTGFPLPGQGVYTGNPVRADIRNIPPPKERYGQRGQEVLRVLILGGSQGARLLNERLLPVLKHVASGQTLLLRHQAGNRFYEETSERYRSLELSATVEGFISNMADAYAWADLVIARSGALTVAELMSAGVASLLIPLAVSADDHQTSNAFFLQQQGACEVLTESELQSEEAGSVLERVLSNRVNLLSMAIRAKEAEPPLAHERVAKEVLEAVHGI